MRDDLGFLLNAVWSNPYDLARQAALADYLQENPDFISRAVGFFAQMMGMDCDLCHGRGGDMFTGTCDACQGSGRRKFA